MGLTLSVIGTHSFTEREDLGVCAIYTLLLVPVWCRLFPACDSGKQQYFGKHLMLRPCMELLT